MSARHRRRRARRPLAVMLTVAAVICMTAAASLAGLAVAAHARSRQSASPSRQAAQPARSAASVSASPSPQSPLTATGICRSPAYPKLAARLSLGITTALRDHDSVVSLAVDDARLDLTCRVDQTWHYDAASAIKATIISALLLQADGPSHLTAGQRQLAWQMITESDNTAATKLWDDVGMSGMQRFLSLAGMTHTELNQAWGLTKITAQDEVALLRLLSTKGTVLSTASRQYILSLMENVTPAQRWGVPAGAPSDVTVHVKNGWLPYPTESDWHVNSIGVFTGHDIDYQVAVLTTEDPTWDAGIDTIQAAAQVINRDLAEK